MYNRAIRNISFLSIFLAGLIMGLAVADAIANLRVLPDAAEDRHGLVSLHGTSARVFGRLCYNFTTKFHSGGYTDVDPFR